MKETPDFFYYDFLGKTEKEIVDILKKLCPDFAPYNYLKKYDLYKGSLFGGTNIYLKRGTNGNIGLVTTKTNIKLFNLDQYPYNFQSECDRNGKPEFGWTGKELLDLVKYLADLYSNND